MFNTSNVKRFSFRKLLHGASKQDLRKEKVCQMCNSSSFRYNKVSTRIKKVFCEAEKKLQVRQRIILRSQGVPANHFDANISQPRTVNYRYAINLA